MSAPTLPVRLPRDLPRRARALFFVALALMDEACEVPGGLSTLHLAVGNDSIRSTRRALTDLVLAGLVHRRRPPKGERNGGTNWRVVVLVQRANRSTAPACTVCGGPVVLLRAGMPVPRYCPKCLQVVRRDRAWREVGMEVWRRGVADGLSEGAIVHRIAARTGVSWYGRTDAENSDAAQGVAPWMVSEGLIDEKWLVYADRARGKKYDRDGIVGISKADRDDVE